MFSSRLPWHLPENRLSQAIAQRRAAGLPILDLTVSNPTLALPELYDGALLSGLGDANGLRYQPSPAGDDRARAAIAAYYARRGLSIDPRHLVLCASTSEGYSWLFQLLCEPGDRVLFPQPSYPLLAFLGGLSSIEVASYPLDFEGRWRIDLATLAGELDEQTRAIVLVSPNNPTGSRIAAAELQALFALCAGRKLALIVDEVFSDYGFSDRDADGELALPSLLAADPQAGPLRFVLSGLSKVVGLPQLKLGWIHVGGPEPLRSEAQRRLEIIADTFLSVSTPVQLLAPSLLDAQPRLRDGIFSRVAENLAQLRSACQGTALTVLPVEAGWYAVVRLPRLCSEEDWVLTLLCEDGVLCHPGYFFDFADEAYVVLSLLTPPAELREGVRRLLARLARLEEPAAGAPDDTLEP